MTSDDDSRALADALKKWRGTAPAHAAAKALGLPVRTVEGIEQGRGFRYPQLLLHALKTMEPPHGNGR